MSCSAVKRVAHGELTIPRKLVTLLEILRSYADAYAKAGAVFGMVGWRFRNDPTAVNDETVLTILRGQLENLLSHCRSAELPITARQIDRILLVMNHPGVMGIGGSSTMSARILELQVRLEDELETRLFFQLPHEKRKFFDTPTVGWNEVLDRFPAATTDVEEMNKCFALSRYAGAVFHSVQTIESGLIEFGKFLGVNDPKSGWTAVSGRLATLVTKTKFNDLDRIYQQHYAFLEQMHGVVEALKSAWRNKISHTQGRLVLMTSDFSPDVAEEIMVASRSFMRRLATEMPT
jgi:hypothetical protein